MQNEILDLHKLSRPPQRRAGIVEMNAQPKGFRDRARPQALVQPRQCVRLSVLIKNFNKLERNYFFSFARYPAALLPKNFNPGTISCGTSTRASPAGRRHVKLFYLSMVSTAHRG